MVENGGMPGTTKRSAPEGTPDREAQNRARHKPTNAQYLMLHVPLNTLNNAESGHLEMSAATIATFRPMMCEKLCDVEQ